MKQILYQLGLQTYSTPFQNLFLVPCYRKKVVIQWLPNFKHTRRLGFSHGNIWVLKASRMPECLADRSAYRATRTTNIKELDSCTQMVSTILVEKHNWTATESDICGNVIRLLKYKHTPSHLPKHCDIPHHHFLSQPRLNLPSWQGVTPALLCCWYWGFSPSVFFFSSVLTSG